MKEGWEIKKLGQVCDLQNGYAFKSGDYVEYSNTVNFRMSQIRPGGDVDLENNPKFLPDKFAITYKDYLLKEGDIVIAMTDMATETKILGVPAIVPLDSRNWLLNQRVGKLFDIDKSKVNLGYLKYILCSQPINDYYKKLGRGGLQINIGKQDILNAEIPLPPLPEQQRIVAILDQCFAAIDKAKANAEQNLKNAKELFESYLQGVFERKGDDWEEKKLGDVFAMKPPKKEVREKLGDTDLVSFLPMEDLGVGEKETKAIREKQLKEVVGSYTYFAENDILLAKITPCFENGKLGIAKNLTNGIGFGSSEYIVFRCRENIVPEFLFYFLLRENFRREGKKYMSGAVGHKRISKDWIENHPFLFPRSIKAQQTIVSQLDALRAETQKLEAIYQKKIDDLEELKKSILQKAFAGELKTEKVL